MPDHRPKSKPRPRLSRRCFVATIDHAGEKRRPVVELDLENATISVRLEGCRTRRKYVIADLWKIGVQLALPL